MLSHSFPRYICKPRWHTTLYIPVQVSCFWRSQDLFNACCSFPLDICTLHASMSHTCSCRALEVLKASSQLPWIFIHYIQVRVFTYFCRSLHVLNAFSQLSSGHLNMTYWNEVHIFLEISVRFSSNLSSRHITYLCEFAHVSADLQTFWTLSHSSPLDICKVSPQYGHGHATSDRNPWQTPSHIPHGHT